MSPSNREPSPIGKVLPAVVCALVAVLVPGSAGAPPPPQASKHVTVINTPSQPVPVIDVGEDADEEVRQPFQDQTQINVAGFLHDPLYTVPQGQRALIETVSVQLTLPVSQGVGSILSVETSVDNVTASHFLVLVNQGVVLSSEARTANHSVRLYADPGTQIFLNGAAQVGSTIFVTLSGYLVDVP
jgi:hypothetical protein